MQELAAPEDDSGHKTLLHGFPLACHHSTKQITALLVTSKNFLALESCHAQDVETGGGRSGLVQGQKLICLGSSGYDTSKGDIFRAELCIAYWSKIAFA